MELTFTKNTAVSINGLLSIRQKTISVGQRISIHERSSVHSFAALGLKFQNLKPPVTRANQQSAQMSLNSAGDAVILRHIAVKNGGDL